MAKFLSGREPYFRVGIESSTEDLTSFSVVGNSYFTGIITASNFVGDGSQLTGIIASGVGIEILDNDVVIGAATTLNFGEGIDVTPVSSGIVTIFTSYSPVAGIASYTPLAGISSYSTVAAASTYAEVAGVATYTILAGIASYSSVADIASYASVAGIATYSPVAGIATYANVAGFSTYAPTAGIATLATVASYATTAGVSTNIKGGVAGNIPYQSATDTTSFVNNGVSGQVLLFTGSVPYWGNVSAATGAFGGISVRDEGTPVGTANSIVTLDFRGSNISVTATIGASGIATVTVGNTVAYATSSGISTYASFAGIATVAVGLGTTSSVNTIGIITAFRFVGDGSGLTGILATQNAIFISDNNSSVGAAGTLNFGQGIDATPSSAGIVTVNVTYSPVAGVSTISGIATSVIGGIGSITSLIVSGVSTFNNNVNIGGTVGIGTIIDIIPYDTLSSGTLSFEGSAGQLFSITNNLTSGSIFSVNDVSGIPSIDVNADGTIQLAPYATNENVGLGTTRPTSKLHVIGNALISGIITAGIVTATTFFGDGSKLSGINAGISSYSQTAGIATVAIGLGTTSSVNTTGIITALRFVGDGSTLSGIVTQWVSTSLGIHTTANVGIGTTRPLYKLHVNGDVVVSGGSSANQHIKIRAYEQDGGALSFEGTSGQLLSISNNLTGTLFAVNNISGFPIVDVNSFGTVSLGISTGNVGVGTTRPTSKLTVIGDGLFTGIVTAIRFFGDGSQLTGINASGISSYSNVAGIASVAVGFGTTSSINTSGIISATAFYGNGQYLTNISRFISSTTAPSDPSLGDDWFNLNNGALYKYVNDLDNSFWFDTTPQTHNLTIASNSAVVGSAITFINFQGDTTISASSGIATITITGGGSGITTASSTIPRGIGRNVTSFTATSGQTIFSTTYDIGHIDVFLNGVHLSESEYTADDGQTIVLSEFANESDLLEIVSNQILFVPFGDYGDLSIIEYDAFGIAISPTFDALTEPTATLVVNDLGSLP